MKDITLQMTTDEANLILEALGNLPFVKVYALIGKSQDQARQQLSESDAPTADPLVRNHRATDH
jgi:hypothetical protein